MSVMVSLKKFLSGFSRSKSMKYDRLGTPQRKGGELLSDGDCSLHDPELEKAWKKVQTKQQDLARVRRKSMKSPSAPTWLAYTETENQNLATHPRCRGVPNMADLEALPPARVDIDQDDTDKNYTNSRAGPSSSFTSQTLPLRRNSVKVVTTSDACEGLQRRSSLRHDTLFRVRRTQSFVA
eukprot:comp22778_c0_seq1/m.35638 comp22778_c0_seq1/g.35638  ORF comp22778_c0_seq1/g.35638 comp22778_c0_seq1/m.35638 type:complete len:181 (-) comp22778_c0_seq1:621-1163(-)